MTFTRHGHHIPGTVHPGTRPEKVYRCGGVKICAQCKVEAKFTKKEDTMPVLETEKYTRKPFDVEAVQVTAANMDLVAKWCDGTVTGEGRERYIEVKVHRPQTPRQTKAFPGDWVLFAGAGFKVYLPKPFEKSFDSLGITVLHPEVTLEPESEVVELLVTTEPVAKPVKEVGITVPADSVAPSPKLMPQFKRQPEIQGPGTEATVASV